MDTRKGLSKELSREWNMHMKLNTGVSHLKNRRKLNNCGMGTVEMILIIVGIFTPYYGVGIRCMA